MPHDFIPRRDADFLGWSRSFSANINSTPAQYGLTPAQAADYALLHDAFAAAYRIAWAPETHTRPSVVTKNQARRNVEREARRLARLIQATPGITATQKSELALTVHDGKPSPVPRPITAPRVFVKLRYGSTVRITLLDQDSPRRGKPHGIAGAMIFSHVGVKPPDSLSQWRMEGGTTRTSVDITFGDGIVPGAKVWITAYWYNPRAQRGPAAQPKCTHIQCPTLMLGNAALRLAA